MKKLPVMMVIAAFACVFISCATSKALDYPEPEFGKPLGYVIDTRKIPNSFEDSVRLISSSSDKNIRFNVYVHVPSNKEWLIVGTGTLKGPGDSDMIRSPIDNLDRYRYFAIESLNDKAYNYQCYKTRNDLYITILDK